MQSNADSNVETDSAVDLIVEVNEFVDPTDSVDALHAAWLNNEVVLVLAGATEAMAVGPRTDAGERQVIVPEYGQVIEGFEPLRSATVQPSMVVEAIAGLKSTEHAATYPIGYPHFGPQAPAS